MEVRRSGLWAPGPREKGETRWRFLAWGDFHVRSRFALSTIPEDKWGTTHSLPQNRKASFFSYRVVKKEYDEQQESASSSHCKLK